MDNARQEEFLGQQSVLSQKIADELILLSPDWWHEIFLDLVYEEASDHIGLKHTVYSKQFPRDTVVPDDDLFDLTFQLLSLFREYQPRVFAKAHIRVWHLDNENWHWEADYIY